MAFIKQHLPCPKCTSSNAYSIGENGWGKCFACDANVPNALEGLTEASEEDYVVTSRVVPPANRKALTEPYRASGDDIKFKALVDRKVDVNTAQKYGVGFRGNDLVFPYGSSAAKVRLNGEKKFTIKGDWSAYKGLFGQERFSAGGKMLIITEGEIDAMSAFQMMDAKYPVVSVRNGAQSAIRDCKENYEFIDSFDSVYICFDSDDAGLEATQKVAELFSRKAKIVKLPNGVKDANDMLVEGRKTEFSVALWRAEQYTPEGIIAGDTLFEEVMKPIQGADVNYPFEGLNKLTYGIRKGELVTLTAGSGLGKSQFLREIVYNILQTTDDEKVGLMFMEESVRKTALSIMSLAANKPLHLPDSQASDEEKSVAYNATLGTGRVYLFDHFGSSDVDSIVDRVRYMAKALDCHYVFLDHISIVVSSQSNGDERKAIDEIMTKLRTLVAETGICLICVSHLKRPENKGHEEGAATSLAQLRGSGSIAQLSDMVIGLERNGQADDVLERNTTKVRVLKNRFSGTTGPACKLLYSLDTGRMTERHEDEEEAL
jgi:twinkle protein